MQLLLFFYLLAELSNRILTLGSHFVFWLYRIPAKISSLPLASSVRCCASVSGSSSAAVRT